MTEDNLPDFPKKGWEHPPPRRLTPEEHAAFIFHYWEHVVDWEAVRRERAKLLDIPRGRKFCI